MALLRLMNFDRSTVLSDFLSDYATVSTPANISIASGGAFGSNSIVLSDQNASLLQSTSAVPSGTIGVLGLRIKRASYGSAYFGISDPNGQSHIHVQINNNNGQISVYQGSTTAIYYVNNFVPNFASTLFTGTIGQVPIGTFNYFQIQYVISATVGSLTLLLNNAVVCALTGVNTKGSGSTNPTASGYRLEGYGLFQDIYVADGTGAAPNNTFLGDVRVYLAKPTGNGTLTQFTPVGAATNWQVAATSPMAPATIYNTANTVGSTDLYTAAPLPASMTTILGVQVEAQIIKTDAGPRTATLEIKSGATVATGASHPLSVSVANYTDIFVVDPATGVAFTAAGVNALQFGPTILT